MEYDDWDKKIDIGLKKKALEKKIWGNPHR